MVFQGFHHHLPYSHVFIPTLLILSSVLGVYLTISSQSRLKFTADKSYLHLKIVTFVKGQCNPEVVLQLSAVLVQMSFQALGE
jgi:hypothetical protein